jgi:hypothetical protein
MSSLFSSIAPNIVRAATFHLDREWGMVVSSMAALYLPTTSGMLATVLKTTLLTLVLVIFERWMNGSLSAWMETFLTGTSVVVTPQQQAAYDLKKSTYYNNFKDE